MPPRGKVKPSSTSPSVVFTTPLPFLRVHFYRLFLGIAQPLLGDDGGALAGGGGFDGFERDGRIAFARAPVRFRAAKLDPALGVFVGSGDGTFNRPRHVVQLGFQVQIEDRMPVGVPVLNQLDGGAVREEILEQRGEFVIPLRERRGVAAGGVLWRHALRWGMDQRFLAAVRAWHGARFAFRKLVRVKLNVAAAVLAGARDLTRCWLVCCRIHGLTFRSGMTFFAASGGLTLNHFSASLIALRSPT